MAMIYQIRCIKEHHFCPEKKKFYVQDVHARTLTQSIYFNTSLRVFSFFLRFSATAIQSNLDNYSDFELQTLTVTNKFFNFKYVQEFSVLASRLRTVR